MVSIEEEMIKYEKLTGYFCQNCFLDKKSDKYDDLVCQDYAEVAIIIQGPIYYEDDFTIETVKLYKKWYPNVTVIVSTWKNENDEVLKSIEECGAIVIRGDAPDETGILNVNLQMTSTMNGIKKAKELGLDISLKTRTNQRLTANNFLDILMHFLECYGSDFPQSQKGRIIVPFIVPHIVGYVCDFMAFGYTDDISNYFGAKMQSVSQAVMKNSVDATAIMDGCFGKYTLQKMYENAKVFDTDETYMRVSQDCMFPEVYLGKNYMQNVLNMQPNVSNYMKMISGAIVCADMKMLGLYWRTKTFGNVGRYNKGLASGFRYEAMYGDWLWLFRRYMA